MVKEETETTLWSKAMTSMSFAKSSNSTKQHPNVSEEGGNVTRQMVSTIKRHGSSSNELDDLAISLEHCSGTEPRQRAEKPVSGSFRNLRRTLSPSEPEGDDLASTSKHVSRAHLTQRVGRNLSETIGKLRQTHSLPELNDSVGLATTSDHGRSARPQRRVTRVRSNPHALQEIKQIFSSMSSMDEEAQMESDLENDNDSPIPNDEQFGIIDTSKRTSSLLLGSDGDTRSHNSDNELMSILPPSLKRSASNPLSLGKMIRAGRKSLLSKDTNSVKKTASTPSLLNEVERQEEDTRDLKNFAWEIKQRSVEEEVPFSKLKLSMSNPFLFSKVTKTIRDERTLNTNTKSDARNEERGETIKAQLPKLKKSTSNPFSLNKFMKASTISTRGERSGNRSITSWVSKKSKGSKRDKVYLDEENVTEGTTSCNENKPVDDNRTAEDSLESGKTDEALRDSEDSQDIKRSRRPRVDRIRSRRKSKDDLTEIDRGDAKGSVKVKKSHSNPNSLGRFRRTSIQGERNATWKKAGLATMRTEFGLTSHNKEDAENSNESTERCDKRVKRPSSLPDLITECCQEAKKGRKKSTVRRKSSNSSGKTSVRKTRSRGESTSTLMSRRKRTSSNSNIVAAVTDTEVVSALSASSDLRKIDKSASTAPESDSERKVSRRRASRSARRSAGQPISQRKSRHSRQQQELDDGNESASLEWNIISKQKEMTSLKLRLGSDAGRKSKGRGSVIGSTLAPSSFACLAWDTPPQRTSSDRSIGASSLTAGSENSEVDEVRPSTPTSFQNSSSLLSLGSVGSLGDRLFNSSSSEESFTTDPVGAIQRNGDHAAEMQLDELQFQTPTTEAAYFDWEAQRLAALEVLGVKDSTDECVASRTKSRDKDRVKTSVRRVKSSGTSSSDHGHLRMASNTRKPGGVGTP